MLLEQINFVACYNTSNDYVIPPNAFDLTITKKIGENMQIRTENQNYLIRKVVKEFVETKLPKVQW